MYNLPDDIRNYSTGPMELGPDLEDLKARYGFSDWLKSLLEGQKAGLGNGCLGAIVTTETGDLAMALEEVLITSTGQDAATTLINLLKTGSEPGQALHRALETAIDNLFVEHATLAIERERQEYELDKILASRN